MRTLAVGLIAAAAIAPGPSAAHGVGARKLGPGAQTVEIYYASGEPMAYATVRVFSPSDPTIPYIDGRADRLGRFAFLPSEPGAWSVQADDGDGHHLAITVAADENAPAAGAPVGLFSAWRVALWLSFSVNAMLLATALRRWLDRRALRSPTAWFLSSRAE